MDESKKVELCEAIYHMAESLGDTELMDYMCDGQAMAIKLDTESKWFELLRHTNQRMDERRSSNGN